MSEDSVIKIYPSVQLKKFINSYVQGWEDVPDRIKLIPNPDLSVRKRAGKAALSTAISSELPFLCVEDFNWLYTQVKSLQESGDSSSSTFLHKLLEECEIVLPQPPVIERY